MKVRSISIKNFRGYKEQNKIYFNNLTLIVGKNDVGKSTILEAGDIFFGNRKADKDDLSISCKEGEKIEITVEFEKLPDEIDLDAGAKTTIKDEYLLNKDGFLEVKKVITPASATQPKIYINANMPKGCENLLNLKNSELKARAETLGVSKDKYRASINNEIRKAIWEHLGEKELEECEIEINKEDGKEIYEKLEAQFPIYTLFSVDRENSDQDDEVQSPIKASIKELVVKYNSELEPIKDKFLLELDNITKGTIEKIKEMNPEVATSLKSIAEKPAWEKAFTIKIESDGVPLNKRGSGVKRLVLINFFRQEADRKKKEKSKIDVFYAIEEPETSQHPDWQIKLFSAFKELVRDNDAQIALTSHHPELCGLVNLEDVRFIKKNKGSIEIKKGDKDNYKEIGKTLGVLPKFEGVKVCICLEGPNDIEFLKNIASIFGIDSNDEKILWIPMGGGTVRDYVSEGYLNNLNLPQVHFYDRDPDSKYKDCVEEVEKNGHWAKLTEMLTIENYFHPILYKKIWINLNGDFVDFSTLEWLKTWKDKNIPTDLSKFITDECVNGNCKIQKINEKNVKSRIAENAKLMTKALFEEMKTYEEVETFFNEIKKNL
ncbi:MAG: ATP-binding protein [Bacilli bacterium]|jgi:AAA15 family ATPase/GTPase|nr:ATP-binding protein [Bacilli bacterium]